MHLILIKAIVFLFGTAVGSFLNCLVYRTETEQKPTGRSFCPKCKHTLSHKDLVPLFSYVFLLGKCRYCSKKISIEYPLVELASGVLFTLTFYLSGFLSLLTISYLDVVYLIYLTVVIFFFIFIFVYDLKHFIIPDFANFSLIGISFGYLALMAFLQDDINILINGGLSALGIFLFFFSLYYFTKGKGMGFGDVKFVIFMGFFLGYPNIIIANFISFLLGAIIGLTLIAFKKKGMKSEVPFGPFLITGTYLAYFFGDKIIEIYLTYL